MIPLSSSGDGVGVYVSAGEARVAIEVEDNTSLAYSVTTAWASPDEARAFAARIIDVADSIDRLAAEGLEAS